jgi:2-phospho-L-lactate guanylyltransferase (CobY/MobA/RfbA family)
MADEVNLTQETLNLVMQYVRDNLFLYLATGTGNNAITLTSEDLESPVQTGSSQRNIPSASTSTMNNFVRFKFRLTSAMPYALPVSLQEFGLHKTATATSDLVAGWTLPVANTKDNQSQWDVTISVRAVELERSSL